MHVFINCVSMETEVAVSRSEVAQRVTLRLTSARSCIHPASVHSFSPSISGASCLAVTPSPPHPNPHHQRESWHPYHPPLKHPEKLALGLWAVTGTWSRRNMSRPYRSLNAGWWCQRPPTGASHSHWQWCVSPSSWLLHRCWCFPVTRGRKEIDFSLKGIKKCS